MNFPVSSSQSSREYLDQSITYAKARFIEVSDKTELPISKSNFVEHDIGSGEKEAWDTTEGLLRIKRLKTQDFQTTPLLLEVKALKLC